MLRTICVLAIAALCSAAFIGREPMLPLKPELASQIALNPDCVDKYVLPLVLPPLMPIARQPIGWGSSICDNYEISVRKINQSGVLPPSSTTCTDYPKDPVTTVFAYGAKKPDGTGTTHNWPGFTIEARVGKAVKVKWVNELYEQSTGQYVKHLFANAIDQTLHWANPAGLGSATNCPTTPLFKASHPICTDFSPCMSCGMTNTCANDQSCKEAANAPSYDGPVPIVTHVHGQEAAFDFADGYAEAWYMPARPNRLVGPAGQTYAQQGTFYNIFQSASRTLYPLDFWTRGNAVFNYPNNQKATQLWYHDHTLGLTRLNVYAGMAGLYQLRNVDVTKEPEFAGLPWPPPGLPNKKDVDVREIPIVVQDRTFDTTGQLFYPVNDLAADTTLPNGQVPPKWIPEYFQSSSTMIVNGRTYPYQNVTRETYRLRLLNGCNARTLILYFSSTLPTTDLSPNQRLDFWVIGNEAGFFPSAVKTKQLLLGPAERYDILFEFGTLPGTDVYLLNAGPGVPYNGFNDWTDGLTLNQAQIMKFSAGSGTGVGVDSAALDKKLAKYQPPNYGPPARTRSLALIELNNRPTSPNVVAVLLGRGNLTNDGGTGIYEKWDDPVTTNPRTSTVEDWDIINLTADAHPIHIHEVYFQVVKKTPIKVDNDASPPTWTTVGAEAPKPPPAVDAIVDGVPCAVGTGTCSVQKDTVLVPSQYIYTLRMKTPYRPGLFVWHCHLLEHEDNEMMRPYCIGQPGYINPKTGKNMCPGSKKVCGLTLQSGSKLPCINT